jgi:DNA (cytosine-5)-methyltransferase 1
VDAAPIPVIDLFSGPGGLACGFAEADEGKTARHFRVQLSVEFEQSAHQTMLLRTFLREAGLHRPEVIADYNSYRQGDISRDTLFKRHADAAKAARKIALKFTLGGTRKKRMELHQRIDEALDNRREWVLLGGPPCQAYSLVGRARRKGDETFSDDGRHVLYREYLEIVAVHRPAVFVMENVKGVLSSRAKLRGNKHASMFEQIRADLAAPWAALGKRKLEDRNPDHGLKYRLYSFVRPGKPEDLKPADFIIRSEDHDIPQKRHRVIILGIRDDLDCKPDVLKGADLFSNSRQSVRAAIGDLPHLRSRVSGKTERDWVATIRAEVERFIGEVNDRDLQQHIRTRVAQLADLPAEASDKAIQHNSRSHMDRDLGRYFYAACFAELKGRTATLRDFPSALQPDHVSARDKDGEASSTFIDRFKVQMADQPSSTVTSHIAKDGHYYIHYDPLQCRSLSVREAALLQTFPEDYHFEGNRTDQYRQVGNAVPPKLAQQLAVVVADIFRQTEAQLKAA